MPLWAEPKTACGLEIGVCRLCTKKPSSGRSSQRETPPATISDMPLEGVADSIVWAEPAVSNWIADKPPPHACRFTKKAGTTDQPPSSSSSLRSRSVDDLACTSGNNNRQIAHQVNNEQSAGTQRIPRAKPHVSISQSQRRIDACLSGRRRSRTW